MRSIVVGCKVHLRQVLSAVYNVEAADIEDMRSSVIDELKKVVAFFEGLELVEEVEVDKIKDRLNGEN